MSLCLVHPGEIGSGDPDRHFPDERRRGDAFSLGSGNDDGPLIVPVSDAPGTAAGNWSSAFDHGLASRMAFNSTFYHIP